MILYLLYIFIIIILCILAYIRIRFPFWAKQPIFHIYDIWYYIFPPGIIQQELPSKTDKYNNFTDIQTFRLEHVSQIERHRFVSFIQQHFLRGKRYHYSPKEDNIWPYMEGLDGGPTFLSFYKKKDFIVDTKTDKIIETDKIVGTMASYPLQVQINNGKPDALFNVYYVDYLCVHTDNRKQNIAPQLIQTHHYQQRYGNRNIQISLFKREGHLTAAIPLCIYQSFGYQINEMSYTPLPASMQVVKVSHNNMSNLVDFIKLYESKFEIVISPSYSNISGLIKTENIHVYLLIEEGKVLCVYFFKKQCTYIKEETKEILTCFASICGDNIPVNIFINGFKAALAIIVAKNAEYNVIIIEAKSDNTFFNKEMPKTIFTIPYAYYFYNFAYKTFQPNKSFILI